jgi:hypothetical protein
VECYAGATVRSESASSPQSALSGFVHRRPRLVLFAVSSLVALALAEVTLRVYFPQIGKLRQLVVSTGDDRGFAPRPNVRLLFDGVFSPLDETVVWQTNAEGLRHEGPVSPLGERFRVAAYGDSETFGWSIALEETFAQQMERLDPNVEVLNLGVPGYNVNNIRDHLERTVPRYQPDLAIYLVNKNDFNEAVTFSPLSYSHVLLHLRFLVHFTVGKSIRRSLRDGNDRIENFQHEVERMTHVLEQRDTPFLVGFLKWRNHEALGDLPSRVNDGKVGSDRRFRFETVNVRKVVKGEPKQDTHYAQSAHRKMAALFCAHISGDVEGSCAPPGWLRNSRTRAARNSR